MNRLVTLATLATVLALPAGLAMAQEEDETPEDIAIEIRHGHMLNYAANLQRLGAMAQGNADYDAAVAQTAADNLHHLAMIDQSHYWLPGTSSEEMPEESAALPAIWETPDEFQARHTALQEAVANLQSVAGTDLAGLQGAMQGVGQACGGCHENFRVKDE